MLDYIRIACAVPAVKVGDVKKNTEDICAYMAKADAQNVDILTNVPHVQMSYNTPLITVCDFVQPPPTMPRLNSAGKAMYHCTSGKSPVSCQFDDSLNTLISVGASVISVQP